MLEIMAWGYKSGDIVFVSSSNTVMTSQYVEHSEWELTETYATPNLDMVPTMRYHFTFKRRSVFMVINLILLVVFLALLNIFVFFLPQDSGERIGYAITLLLTVVV